MNIEKDSFASSRRSRTRSLSSVIAVGAASVVALASCSTPTPSGPATGSSSTSDDKISVSASFYPVAWLAEQIGTDAVTVSSVTPANVEPHEFELSPADISNLSKSQLIVYVKGFQPSLDDAVATVSGPTVIDLSPNVSLEKSQTAGDTHEDEHADEHEGEHAEDAHEHGEMGLDPHFWLDPVRMKAAASALTDALSKAHADKAEVFKANLSALDAKLTTLDSDFSSGLKQCKLHDVVTSHAAFSYLTERYGLNQYAISGVDPEAEPSPSDLANVKKVVSSNGTTTIFTEELVSPKTAQAVAQETGAKTAVLSPIESKPESGDYISAMQNNLKELRSALQCQ
ncbi:MAG: metal ABC transporter substrate-binding protein [Actinomycetaceae bacterium]|nr:metal ABC transporter substrate-binding protein [Arcanobacterium sp.]MDD7687374.1 metal ABC transporter substrate-binding protein [Actinomycetaceae bacterium]MDY5274143.1 metal ABC transporter substrate-binding protein [Arcanobacterium sp.]